MSALTLWGPERLLNTASSTNEITPAIEAFADGSYIAVWAAAIAPGDTDAVVARLFNADGTPKGAEFRVNTTITGMQKMPKVTILNDGRFVVTWEDNSAIGIVGTEIRARIFNADGTPHDRNGDGINDDPDFVINTLAAGSQVTPSISALSNGGFVVAYQSPQSGDQNIVAQSYDASGQPLGAEVTVNLTTSNPQREPIVAGLSGNRYVALWVDNGPADDSGAIYTIRGRIMAADGGSGGSEFLVPSSRGSKQDITVTELANGKFVVAWTHYLEFGGNGGSDGSGSSVKAQIFNADGTMYRGEFIVNTPTENFQKLPSMTALPDGGFAISYIDVSTGQTQIRVATFDKEGGRSNADIVVGPPPGSTVGTKAVITTLADGRLFVSWDETGSTRADDVTSVRGQVIDPRSTAVNLAGTGGNDDYFGTIYNDKLNGGDGADKLSGDLGNDTLIGGKGGDTLNGGRTGVAADTDGTDYASYEGADAGVTASLLTPSSNTGDAKDDIYLSIEGLIGSAHADHLSGDGGANTLQGGHGGDQLFGNGGVDRLSGDDGDDVLDGGAGADLLQGGRGDDSYIVDNASDKIEESVGEGYDKVTASVSYTLEAIAEIEELRAQAGAANIDLTGNGGHNKLYGNDGANQLNGGAGADALEGGLGDDVYVLDDAADVVIEATGVDAGYDTVAIASNFAGGTYRLADYANIEALKALDGAGKIDLIGAEGANKLTGNAFDNVLEGRAGNDEIDGGGGVNTAVFTGAKAEYSITKNAANGTYIVADGVGGRDGTDLLKNVRYLRFNDGIVDLEQAVPTLSVAATDAAKSEGDAGSTNYTFTVTRNSTNGVSTVDWNLTGIGGNGAAVLGDFEGLTSGTLRFEDGESEKTITLKVKGDKEIEGHETFSVTLSNAFDATIATGTATGTIINDDVLPVLSIAATDVAKAEGDSGETLYNFVVTRNGSTGVSTATWKVSGIGSNNAASDEDFLALMGTVRFEDGETSKVISVRVKTDTLLEGDETFSIVLSSPTGATILTDMAYGTIANDDVPVDTAPTALRLTTGGTVAWIDENKSAGTLIATMTADDDKGASGLRYSMTDSTFEIDAITGQIRLKNGAALNFEAKSTYTVTVTATDLHGTGQATAQDIVINLNDLAEKPTGITFNNASNLKLGISGVGDNVALASAVDLEATGAGANLYRFDNGQSTTPDGLFVINAVTGQITINRALAATDVGIKTLNVVAYDADNPSLSHVQSHTVRILSEDNGAPYDISLSKTSIDENSLIGSVVATLSAADSEGATDILDYSIVFDEDDKFRIVGNELRLKAGVDHEAKGSHRVTIRVKDKSGNTYDEDFEIFINDVNEKPKDITFSEAHILKVGATGIGTNVVSAAATDLDATSGFATNLYRFENGQTTMDGLFTINTYTGQVTTLRALTADDVGTKTLTIVAYDASNSTLFQVKTQTITVLGAGNLAPTSLTLSANRIAENSAGETVIGALAATDWDAGDTRAYSIVSDSDGKFDIIDGKLVLKRGATLDYEAKSSHQVTVRVTDKGNLFRDEVFTVNVTNENDAPTNLRLSSTSIDEEAGIDTFVGNLIVADQDESSSYVYELLDDAGGRFKLSADGKSILVADGSKLDYETATSHKIRVKVIDGVHTREEDIVIGLSNKLEPGSPEIIVDPNLDETSAPDDGTLVNPFMGVTFFDPDNDNLTVRLSFNASAGELRIPVGLENWSHQLKDDGTIVYTFTGTYVALEAIMDVVRFMATPRPNVAAGTTIATTFTIEASDGTSLVVNKDVKVNALVTNRAPTDVWLNNASITEQAGTNGWVGDLLAADQAGAGFRFDLIDTAGGRFKLSGNQILVDNGTLLDFEQGQAHAIRVQVTDQGGATFVKSLMINVADWVGENLVGTGSDDRLYANVGDDTLRGIDGNDALYSGIGNDVLYGGIGNDFLYGGAGKDTLRGEKGKDVFVFDTALNAKTNVDKIVDFNVKDDTIHLENAYFKKLGSKTGKLKKDFFTVGSKAKDKNDYIVYDSKKGVLYYDTDGSGKGKAVLFATVQKNLKMTFADFHVI